MALCFEESADVVGVEREIESSVVRRAYMSNVSARSGAHVRHLLY